MSKHAYECDFGDSWHHSVVVEEPVRLPYGLKDAICLDGESACPPKECGGVGGYADLLEALADPTHEEHDHLHAWVGGAFDPEACELAAINIAPQRLR